MRTASGQALGLFGFVVICLAVGGVGGWMTAPEIATWYAALAKPPFNPPNWIFGPVWTALYLLMAVAGWLMWRRAGTRGATVALALFALQLALNAAWSWLFFGLHRIDLALADIVLLAATIAATALSFRRHNPVAALLLVPYLAWVAFATVLNFAIWRLN